MKKIALIISLFTFGLSVNAQEEPSDVREEFKVGVKAGVNYSNVYNTRGEDFTADPKYGFVGGGFLSIPLSKFIGLQPEVLYSQKGFEGSGTFLGSGYSYRRTSTYLDVPLYFVLKPIKTVSLLVGPQYSYLLRQRDEFNSSSTSFVSEEEFENDNIRKNTLGVMAGVDLNFSNAVIGARIGWDLQDNKGDGTSSVPNYKNTVAQATFGFKF